MAVISPRGLLAILAVVDIALHSDGRLLSARHLATRYNLSPRYMEPMLRMLAQVGILRGVRGPHGGYRLGRQPSALTLDDIIRSALARADSYPVLSGHPMVAQVILPALADTENAISEALRSITIDMLTNRATDLGFASK